METVPSPDTGAIHVTDITVSTQPVDLFRKKFPNKLSLHTVMYSVPYCGTLNSAKIGKSQMWQK